MAGNSRIVIAGEEEETPEGEDLIVLPDPVESETDEEMEDFGEPMALEDLDPEEVLWPDGPTVGDILAWKEKFGDVYVTSLTVEKHYVWRTMSRLEYKAMIKDMERLTNSGQLSAAEVQMYQEEYIASKCLLFPALNGEQLANEMAGVATIIAQEVMDASGFVALEVRQL